MTKAEMDFRWRTIKSERDLLAMQLVEERARTRRLRAALGALLEEYASTVHLPAEILNEAEAALEESK